MRKSHGGVKGGRSHGGDLAVGPRGMTGDRADGGGDPGGDKDPKRPCDTDGSGDQGGATVMSF